MVNILEAEIYFVYEFDKFYRFGSNLIFILKINISCINKIIQNLVTYLLKNVESKIKSCESTSKIILPPLIKTLIRFEPCEYNYFGKERVTP